MNRVLLLEFSRQLVFLNENLVGFQCFGFARGEDDPAGKESYIG
jgi:hypothetical protein